MQVLSPRHHEILSLMGVEVWRQRVQGEAGSQRMDSPSWVIVEQPEVLVSVIVVCECESANDGLSVAEQKLLDNILRAAGWRRDECLVVLFLGSDGADNGEPTALLEQAQCRADVTTLLFGSRAGECCRDALASASARGPTAILPALSTMLTAPQSKRQCWNQLRELLASGH